LRVTSAVAAAQALAGIANRALGSAGASDTTVRDAKLIRCDMFLDDVGLEDALVQPFTTMQSSSTARMATTPNPSVQVVVRWAIDLPGLVSSSDVNILNIPGTNRDVGAALRLEGTSVLDLVPMMLSAKPPSNGAEAAAAVLWRVKVHKLANVSANGAPLTALGTALGNLRSVRLGGRVNDPTSSTSSSSPLGQSLWSQLQASAERALDTSLALAAAQAQTEASKSGQQWPEHAPLTRLSEDEEAPTSATPQSQVAEAKTPLAGGALPKTWPWVLPGTGAWEDFAAAEAAFSNWLAYLPWQFQQSPPPCALAPDVGLLGLAGEVVLTGSEAYESAMLGLGGLRRTGKQQLFLALADAEDTDIGDSRSEASSPPPCVDLLAVTVTSEKTSSSEKQLLQIQDESRNFAASGDPAAELARETATTAWARSTSSSNSSSGGGHTSPGPGAWFEVEVKWRYRAGLRVSSSGSGGGLLGAAMPPAPLNFEGRCVYRFDRTLRSGGNSPETGKSRAVEPIDYLLSKHRVMAAAVNGIEVESSAVTQWVSRLSSGSGASTSSDRSSTGVGSAQALAELASWLQRQSIVNSASSSRSSTRADTTSSRKGAASTSEDSAKDSKGGDGGAFSAPAWRAQLPASGRLMPKFSASSSPLLRSPPPRRRWHPPAADAALSANAAATASVGSAADAAVAARRAELASVAAFLDALHFSTPRSLATPLLPSGWLRPDVQLKGQLDEPWAVGKPSVEALCSAFVTITARLLADGTLVPAVSPRPNGEASGASTRSTSSNSLGSAAQAAARAEAASIAAMTHAVEYTPEGHVLLRWRADLEARPPFLGLAGPSLPLTVEGTSLLILDASAIAATPGASPAASGTAAIIDIGPPVPLVAEHRVLEVAINGQPSLSQVADWAQQWSQGARPSSTALAAAPFKLFEWLARYSR